MKHVCFAYLAFPVFSSSIDRETGVEVDYTDEPYYYSAESGKRSPRSNPSFSKYFTCISILCDSKCFLLESPIIVIFLAAFNSLHTAPSMTRFYSCASLEPLSYVDA